MTQKLVIVESPAKAKTADAIYLASDLDREGGDNCLELIFKFNNFLNNIFTNFHIFF